MAFLSSNDKWGSQEANVSSVHWMKIWPANDKWGYILYIFATNRWYWVRFEEFSLTFNRENICIPSAKGNTFLSRSCTLATPLSTARWSSVLSVLSTWRRTSSRGIPWPLAATKVKISNFFNNFILLNCFTNDKIIVALLCLCYSVKTFATYFMEMLRKKQVLDKTLNEIKVPILEHRANFWAKWMTIIVNMRPSRYILGTLVNRMGNYRF